MQRSSVKSRKSRKPRNSRKPRKSIKKCSGGGNITSAHIRDYISSHMEEIDPIVAKFKKDTGYIEDINSLIIQLRKEKVREKLQKKLKNEVRKRKNQSF